MINLSNSVPIKQLKASSGVFTIGSPRTLKDVFISINDVELEVENEIIDAREYQYSLI